MVSVLPPHNSLKQELNNNRLSQIAEIEEGTCGAMVSATPPQSSPSLRAPRWVTLSVSLFSQHVNIVETQMFATFIDNKIVSQWQDPDRGVKVFDLRNNVKAAEGNDEGGHQKAVYEKLNNIHKIGELI